VRDVIFCRYSFGGVEMIDRPSLLNWLLSWRDKDMIKVVTGIRRCGKSTLFELYQKKLLESGVKKEQIISINFEDNDFADLETWRDVWEYLKKRINSKQKNYIFLDEVQRISEFEKLVDGLYVKKYSDVYITGSNAYMLSGELATFLSGRYVELRMQPLSFKEYVNGAGSAASIETQYKNYLRFSSFPYALTLEGNEKMTYDYLSGIYNTILMKDILARKGYKDVAILERVVRYLFDNIGNLTSIRKIKDTLVSSGCSISYNTVESYITALCETFLLYQVGRYDVKGREYLKTGAKYYVADIGLRYFLLGNKGGDLGHILENIVYLELVRRSRNVSVGKVDRQEVDFITQDGNTICYYQVSLSVRDENTLKRELAPLEAIRDSNPKYLLTLDQDPPVNHNGIQQICVFDFLLENETNPRP
jgi:predicted AAA+ superfamily ATPase